MLPSTTRRLRAGGPRCRAAGTNIEHVVHPRDEAGNEGVGERGGAGCSPIRLPAPNTLLDGSGGRHRSGESKRKLSRPESPYHRGLRQMTAGFVRRAGGTGGTDSHGLDAQQATGDWPD